MKGSLAAAVLTLPAATPKMVSHYSTIIVIKSVAVKLRWKECSSLPRLCVPVGDSTPGARYESRDEEFHCGKSCCALTQEAKIV